MKHESIENYSILLRLRRVTYEDAYVSVPITEAILEQKENGTYGVNVEAFFAEGIRLSQHPDVEWVIENSTTETHPVQQPKPEGRTGF